MPKSKKSATESSDSDSGPDRSPPPKKSKDSSGSQKGKTSEGEAEGPWILDKQRQIRINEFRGRKFVDIREYYEKDGELRPGKKGISLSIPQWKKLVEVVEKVNRALEE